MTYLDIEKIIDKPYVGIEDTMKLAGVGYNKAREILTSIITEMIEEGFPVFHQRKRVVPTRRVVERLHIDTEYVRKQASQIKEVQYGDLRANQESQ